MSLKIWSISQLVSYIKQQLANDFTLKNISVQGEIGNFTNHFSGHWYFTLKDDKALINCAMFKGFNQYAEFLPKNGDSVLVTGNVSIFEKSGQMQLIVSSIKMSGQGDFYAQFEKTRNKLEPLGYFDQSRKKPIPDYPRTISVVTGANTAALQDIRITLRKRWPVELREVYAIVQGQEAIESVVNALKAADGQNSDILILARGGGSIDDLWCFNDERIAEAIHNCRTPVITGIGHEIDTTIADLVADWRAATPTAAAVAATPDFREVLAGIYQSEKAMLTALQNRLNQSGQLLDYDYTKLQGFRTRIMELETRVGNNRHLLSLALLSNSAKAQQKIEYLRQQMRIALTNRYRDAENRLANLTTSLDALSPLKTMKRGYIISQQKGSIIKSVNDIDIEKNIRLIYADGSIDTRVVKEK
ncbi:MAG: exodeoxyribonuclease VII large subunit [Erysipelotrichaceae bacterium]|nr:exodeoxyribonuclease VII large subunit [Erysipelotrichaceae bacterium]